MRGQSFPRPNDLEKKYEKAVGGTATYLSGIGSFTVPALIYSLNVEVIGGAGAIATNTAYAVTPAQVISATVGAGLADSTFGTLTATGGASSDKGKITVRWGL